MASDVGTGGSDVDKLGDLLGAYAWVALARIPGSGVCVCTLSGNLTYCSAGEADHDHGEKAKAGKSDLRAAMPEPWAVERLGLLKRAHDERRTITVRGIWRGVQLISVIVPISGDDAPAGEPSCLVVTQRVAGEITENGDVTFSRLVNLGAMSPLSPRELEVLALIGRGLPTRKIAETLDLSPKTVEKHRDAIVRKTGEKSRIRLAVMAHDAGLTPEDAKRERV